MRGDLGRAPARPRHRRGANADDRAERHLRGVEPGRPTLSRQDGVVGPAKHLFYALYVLPQNGLDAALGVAGFAGLPEGAKFLADVAVKSLLAAVPFCTMLERVRDIPRTILTRVTLGVLFARFRPSWTAFGTPTRSPLYRSPASAVSMPCSCPWQCHTYQRPAARAPPPHPAIALPPQPIPYRPATRPPGRPPVLLHPLRV